MCQASLSKVKVSSAVVLLAGSSESAPISWGYSRCLWELTSFPEREIPRAIIGRRLSQLMNKPLIFLSFVFLFSALLPVPVNAQEATPGEELASGAVVCPPDV